MAKKTALDMRDISCLNAVFSQIGPGTVAAIVIHVDRDGQYAMQMAGPKSKLAYLSVLTQHNVGNMVVRGTVVNDSTKNDTDD